MSVLHAFSLAGKTALVTGGAGPLFGSSISEALAEAGASVVIASRNLDSNVAFVNTLNEKGYTASADQLDITDPTSISDLGERIKNGVGGIDILVNSAVVGRGGGFDEQTPEYWQASAQGNMAGLFAMCKTFMPMMIERGGGSIINVSSIYGVVGNDPSLYEGTDMTPPPDYTFVKGGMINFTRYLANFYGKQGIRANCICPGGYFNNQPEQFVANYARRTPLGRMLNNEDLKGSVVFLASDASAYVTGITLMVDGGFTSV